MDVGSVDLEGLLWLWQCSSTSSRQGALQLLNGVRKVACAVEADDRLEIGLVLGHVIGAVEQAEHASCKASGGSGALLLSG